MRPSAVRFTGVVDDAALASLRAQAGVALVPTRARETFGLAALEAMAAGLPTVATDLGALAELGSGVILVAPDDADALARDTLLHGGTVVVADGLGVADSVAGILRYSAH